MSSIFSNGAVHVLTAYGINTPSGSNPAIASRSIGPCFSHVTAGQRVVLDGDGTVYATHSGVKLAIPSASVFDSYSGRWVDGTNSGFRWDRINHEHQSAMDSLSSGAGLRYRQGSVIQDPNLGSYYVVDQSGEWGSNTIWSKRPIVQADLAACGITAAMIRSDPAIADNTSYLPGNAVSGALCPLGQRPNGMLIKGASTGTVYRVEQDPTTSLKVLQPVTGQAFSTWGFNWGEVIVVPDAEVLLYAPGSTLLRAEGSLMQQSSNGAIWMVETTGSQSGETSFVRRYFGSGCSIVQDGLQLSDAAPVSDSEVSSYQRGPDMPVVC